jgi:hypothetical protein
MSPDRQRWIVRHDSEDVFHNLRSIPLGQEQPIECGYPELGIITLSGQREESLGMVRNQVRNPKGHIKLEEKVSDGTNLVEDITHFQSRNRNDVLRGRNQTIHTSIPIYLYPCLLDELYIFLILLNAILSRGKFPALWR